jgi:hypothetical protein
VVRGYGLSNSYRVSGLGKLKSGCGVAKQSVAAPKCRRLGFRFGNRPGETIDAVGYRKGPLYVKQCIPSEQSSR